MSRLRSEYEFVELLFCVHSEVLSYQLIGGDPKKG